MIGVTLKEESAKIVIINTNFFLIVRWKFLLVSEYFTILKFPLLIAISIILFSYI